MMMDLESHIKEVAYRDKVLKGGPQLESSRNVLFDFQGMFSTYFGILLFAVLGRLLNPSERYYGNYELSRYPSEAGHTVHIPRPTTSSHELPSGVYPRHGLTINKLCLVLQCNQSGNSLDKLRAQSRIYNYGIAQYGHVCYNLCFSYI